MPKITRVEAFQVSLPLHEGSYKWSDGKSVEVFDSTVVAIHTDAGLTGHGEVCPVVRQNSVRLKAIDSLGGSLHTPVHD